MTVTEALELAGRIQSEAVDKVTVRVGKTNGEGRVHLMYERQATTLKDPSEWDESPLRRRNAAKKHRTKRERVSELATEADLKDGLDTIYEPED